MLILHNSSDWIIVEPPSKKAHSKKLVMVSSPPYKSSVSVTNRISLPIQSQNLWYRYLEFWTFRYMAPLQDLGNRFPSPAGHSATYPINKTISSCLWKHWRLSQLLLHRLTSEPTKYQCIQATDKDHKSPVFSWRPRTARPTRPTLQRGIFCHHTVPSEAEFGIPEESCSALIVGRTQLSSNHHSAQNPKIKGV